MRVLNLDGNFELCEFRGRILHYMFEFNGGDPTDFQTKQGRFIVEETENGGLHIQFVDSTKSWK